MRPIPRFEAMEREITGRRMPAGEATLEEMEAAWERVKAATDA